MKRAWFLTLAVMAAMTMGLKAQDASFDGLMSNLPRPAASAPAVPPPAFANPAPQSAAAVERDWLVLVFMNGVNDLGIMNLVDNDINEMEEAEPSARTTVLVQYSKLSQDGSAARNIKFQRGAKTLRIVHDADQNSITSPVILDSTRTDMGDPATFVRFLKSGIKNYPAKRIAVILWNHGAGLSGISLDDASNNRIGVDQLGLALAELKSVLGRKINLFATDACLMQMAEVAYELKDSAEVIVGSEEIVPGKGYPYTPILTQLSAAPGMDAEALGRVIVDAYGASYEADATLSALRTSALPGFVTGLNRWVTAVTADPAAFAVASNAALLNETSHFSTKESKDLVDYLERVEAGLKDSQPVKDAGAALRGYISSRLVIRNAVKPADRKRYTQANGLAVYIPDYSYDSGNYEKLTFTRDSKWDDFILDLRDMRLK